MTNSLIALYAIAWAWCSMDAKAGIVFLALVSGIISFPFFVFGVLRILTANALISVVLLTLSILFPPLAAFVAVWAVLVLILKFARLARNIPPILCGILLYAMLNTGPRALRSTSVAAVIDGHVPLLASAVLAIVGAAIMFVALLLLERFGYSRPRGAALMLGFTGYLTLFVIMLFVPGIDGDSGDLDASLGADDA